MFKQLFVMMTLSLPITACQTAGPDLKAKEADILDSQKGIARQSLDTGKPQTALQTLRPLLRAHPEDASLQTLMGLTQLALKNSGRAVIYFKSAYKLDPKSSTGLNLSAAYIESGDYEKARVLLMTLRKRAEKENYATTERIFQNLGMVAVKQKHLAKAESWFQAAIEENPTFVPAHLELARLYEQTRRPAMALKSYRSALDFCQVCYEPVEALSNTYMKTGRYTDARLVLAHYVQNEQVTPEDKSRAQRLLSLANSTALGGQGAATRVQR